MTRRTSSDRFGSATPEFTMHLSNAVTRSPATRRSSGVLYVTGVARLASGLRVASQRTSIVAREIQLTRGKVAIVDDEDYDRLHAFKWLAIENRKGGVWYAARTISGRRKNGTRKGGRTILMHREILNTFDRAIETDHINHNGLDNRRQNIRTASASNNRANLIKRKKRTSWYKGVSWDKTIKKWRATITHLGKHHFIGRFATENQAAVAYNKKADALFKEFACTNVISTSRGGRRV